MGVDKLSPSRGDTRESSSFKGAGELREALTCNLRDPVNGQQEKRMRISLLTRPRSLKSQQLACLDC